MATGVLAFSCARNIVIVGDLKQLPNVLTEEERQYAHDPLTHVDFLLFNQMDKQPVLAIEVDGTGFHEAGSKQAERDIKKNSILEKCAVPLLRLRTDGSGEKRRSETPLCEKWRTEALRLSRHRQEKHFQNPDRKSGGTECDCIKWQNPDGISTKTLCETEDLTYIFDKRRRRNYNISQQNPTN